MTDKVFKSESQWAEELTPRQYEICRGKGTERPFTGEYNDCKDAGTYVCSCCGNPLFSSETKYDSGSGWPSFYAAIDDDAVVIEEDRSLAMARTEILCTRCDAHLGHVFNDGPAPTGLRYCTNSVSMKLIADDEK